LSPALQRAVQNIAGQIGFNREALIRFASTIFSKETKMPRKTTKTTATRHTAVPKVMPPAAKAAAPETKPQVQPAQTIRHAEVQTLIAQLRHDDADVSRDAATALGALGHVEAVEPLVQVVENRDGYFHPVVRAAAAASLGTLKDARALDVLINAVKDAQAEPSAAATRAPWSR
jgi:HEAT repeat protein